jgi:cation/acetate symporter
MLSGGRGDGRAIGQAYAVYAVAFVVFATVVAVLGELGVVERLVALLVIGVPLVSFAVIGIVSGTLSEGDFLVAGRQVPAVFNGFTGAVAIAGLTGLMGPAAIFLADPASGAAIVLGTATGLAFLAILVAPYFRKSGAVTVAEFLAIRYGGRLVRLVGIAVLVAIAFPTLVAALGAAGWVGAQVFGIPANAAVTVAVVLTLLAALFGGVRGVTLVAGAEAVVFLLALLVPPALAALQDSGFPLPQLTYGYTLAEANAFEGKVTLLAGRLFPVGATGSGMAFATFLTLAAAFAVLPQLLLRTSSARGIAHARRSAGWTLFFALPALFTAPAIAAYVKLAVFNDVIGSSADDLPDWIFDYGRHGLVKLCGIDATSLAAVKAACTPLLGADGVIGSAALAIDPDVVGLGFAGIVGLPYVVTALIAAGAIAASLAAAGALLGSVANAFGHDLYGRIGNRRATAGRRLIVTRLLYVILAALAGWFAIRRPDASFTLAAGMPALAAGALFPTVFLGIWWRRTTRLGALAGIAAGVAGVVGHFLIARHGGSGIVLGYGSAAVPALAAGLYGLVLGFAATIAVSLATPTPDDERQAVIDAIRRPRRDAVLEDGGA